MAHPHELAGGLDTTVDVHSADDGLERVAEDGRLHPSPGRVLALAQQQTRTDVEGDRHLGQRRCVDDALAQVGQCTFGEVAETMKHQVSDNPAEDRVAKKLEPLVAVLIVGLGNPGTMAHCPPKQFGVTKCVTQALLKSRQGQGSTACALVDVVDRVADRLEILKVLVFDSEPVGAIRQLLLNRLDEFD